MCGEGYALNTVIVIEKFSIYRSYTRAPGKLCLSSEMVFLIRLSNRRMDIRFDTLVCHCLVMAYTDDRCHAIKYPLWLLFFAYLLYLSTKLITFPMFY